MVGDRVLGLGTDIVEISRISRAVSRHGEAFLGRVYTPRELQYAGDGKGRDRRLAGRWAAKEAIRKTLGALLSRVTWKDVEILPGEAGEPVVNLLGETSSRVREMGGIRVRVSISHSGDNAVAVALLLGNGCARDEGGSPGHGR